MIALNAKDNNTFMAGKPVSVVLKLSYLENNNGLMADDIVVAGFTKKDSMPGKILCRRLLEEEGLADTFTIEIMIRKLKC